jgi:hypothetical protein
MNCLVLPYTTLPVSANQLKQTRWGSYGEAIINVGVSLVLIRWDPLLGVAIGTLAATLFKSLFYVNYTAKHILRSSVWPAMSRFAGAAVVLLIVSCIGMTLLWNVSMANFFVWILWAVVVFLLVGAVTLLFGAAAYPKELKPVFQNLLSKRKA